MMLGGWWVDTDIVCLSPKLPESEIFLEREDEATMGSAVIKFPKGHGLANALYDKCREAGKDLKWGQTGPALLSLLSKQMGFWDRSEIQKCAFPIHYRDLFLPVTKRGRDATYERTRSAAFLHLWNEMIRRSGSSALNNPPNGSFLAELYKKHGVQRSFWPLVDRYKLKPTFIKEKLKRIMHGA
jgi:hypothetical protein